MTLYPAWQVPVFYIILGVALAILLENYRKCQMRRKDIISIVITCIALVISVGIVLYISRDTVQLVMNTAYPGSRVSVGGNVKWYELFKGWGNIFFPFYLDGIPINPCESASFIDFFPLGIILAFYVFFKKRKKDVLLIILLVLLGVMTWYALVGVPEIVAKLTGLSLSGDSRVMVISGVVNLMLLFRALSFCEFQLSKRSIVSLAFIYAIAVVIISKIYYKDYLTVGLCAVLVISIVVMVFCILKNKQTFFAGIAVIISLVGGLGVNPVQRGINIIYQFPLAQKLQAMEQENDGKWAVVNCEYPRTEYLLLYGLPEVNSTNIYPSLDTWKKLDINGEYEEIYNRYAHIVLQLGEKEKNDKFQLTNADAFLVHVTIDDLKKLDVKYIFSGEKLQDSSIDDRLDLLAASSGYYIYEIAK